MNPPQSSVVTRSLLAAVSILALAAAPFTRSVRAVEVGGTLSSDTTWTAADNPWIVTSSVTVTAAATLTIQPGVVVQFQEGLRLTVQGRLLAEGSPTNRIQFTRNPGSSSWSRLDFTANLLESRITFADISYATGSGNVRGTGTTLYLEGIVWANTSAQLLDLNNCSITLLDSVLPTISGNELYHHGGLPGSGHALIRGNFFGSTSGYNDIIDFTGGNRPGPIVQFIDNVFAGGPDDCFDMDGTDAHIEGNIFMNVHQDAARESSSNPITTGEAGGNTSELMICRNIFYDCDHALLLKNSGSAVLQNNTLVSLHTNSVSSAATAAVNFYEPRAGVTPGRAALLDGNLIWDVQGNTLALNFTNGTSEIAVRNTVFPSTNFAGAPGLGNLTSDPLFVNWQSGITAGNIRSNLALLPGSPAIGTGPNGLDRGALVSPGASISGEPPALTTNDWAILTVGGPGIVGYQWKLNDGPWSGVMPLTNDLIYRPTVFDDAVPITLSNLDSGTYTVSVLGVNSAGTLQDTNTPSVSKTWTVRPTHVEVGGALTSNTVWSAAVPVHVTNTVLVPSNITLTVEGGALLKIGTGLSIVAQSGGTIDVKGTVSNPVLFRSLNGDTNWARLGADGAGATLTMRYADAEHGQVAVLNGASALIEHCAFRDYLLSGGGTIHTQPIFVSDNAVSLVVRACSFANYYETLFRNGVITIEDCLFENVTGDAVDFDTAWPGSVIRRSTFRQGAFANVDAVDLGSQTEGVLVDHCWIQDFPFDKGVSIGEHSSNITVRACLILGVQTGIAVKDSSDVLAINNTIADCDYAIRCYEKTAGQGAASGTGWNNILWNTTTPVELLNGSTLALTYSDVEEGYAGTSNLNATPMFLNVASNDFRLAAGSPCIGTGANGSTMGAIFPVGSFLVDTDGDELPDTWEMTYGLNFNDPGDAALDSDDDRLSNEEEFRAGTEPDNADSVLKLLSPSPGTGGTMVSFQAAADRTYSVLHREALGQGSWSALTNVPAHSNATVLVVVDTGTRTNSQRLYRVVTPAILDP